MPWIERRTDTEPGRLWQGHILAHRHSKDGVGPWESRLQPGTDIAEPLPCHFGCKSPQVTMARRCLWGCCGHLSVVSCFWAIRVMPCRWAEERIPLLGEILKVLPSEPCLESMEPCLGSLFGHSRETFHVFSHSSVLKKSLKQHVTFFSFLTSKNRSLNETKINLTIRQLMFA